MEAEESIDLLGDDYTAASSVIKDHSKPHPTPYFLSSKITSFFSTKTPAAPISPLNSTSHCGHIGNDMNDTVYRKVIDPNSPYDKASKILFDDADEERDQILFTDTFLRTGNLPPYPTNLTTNLKAVIDSAEKHRIAATTVLAEGADVVEDRCDTEVDESSVATTELSSEHAKPNDLSTAFSALETSVPTKEFIPRKGVPPLSQGKSVRTFIDDMNHLQMSSL